MGDRGREGGREGGAVLYDGGGGGTLQQREREVRSAVRMRTHPSYCCSVGRTARRSGMDLDAHGMEVADIKNGFARTLIDNRYKKCCSGSSKRMGKEHAFLSCKLS